MEKQVFLDYLRNRDFTTLFTECGWSSPTSEATIPVSVTTNEAPYLLREVAQKQFKIYTCETDAFPPSSIRRALDAKIRKHSHAYFVIFTLKGDPMNQQWFVPVDAVDTRRFVVRQYADDEHALPLKEKMEGLTFGTEDKPSIVDVISRVNAQFLQNANRVTDAFYSGFRKQHDAFVKEMVGIDEKTDREWYASVMLNRLMFCYFIQKKGFFMDKDGNADPNYLQNMLKRSQDKGNDLFYGKFYKKFLRGLFREGLNTSAKNRSQKFISTYGLIPYLNGGMFAEHEIEEKYGNERIDIPDKVFVALFKFFDEWNWHLDDRQEHDGRDINPDVLGYIFEQYINASEKGSKGAYYTKEDITEYIGRNCILPYLFSKVEKADPKPFKKDGFVWQTLKTSKDAYIFDAVKKGVDIPLPDYIEQGVPLVDAVSSPRHPGKSLRERRSRWNEPATAEYALPTEIWRETVARRQRYVEIRAKIDAGEITNINDFITYNLKIRDFAEDLIRNCKDHLFVKHFYDALRQVTVLDPTCGSGAFLFAALKILEPLYAACLDRMAEQDFVRYFRDELAEIRDHYRSNRQYFIYKNIILRNLYGVDIMHEATEIARLRLFLKMVAVVDADPNQDNLGLDPLPDIDFNIRCGNTLVGYASPEHVQKSLEKADPLGLYRKEEYRKISNAAADIAVLAQTFRNHQLQRDIQFSQEKKELKKLMVKLGNQLDETLAKMDYDIDPATPKGKIAFAEWKVCTQPFHWYSEFYNIIVEHGGFDVIIGNPPYVVYSAKAVGYRPQCPYTFQCKDLYAYVVERSVGIVNSKSLIGMIVPISIVSTDGFKPLRDFLTENCPLKYFSNYAMRPGKLFEGAEKHLTIFVAGKDCSLQEHLYTSKYYRWYAESREDKDERRFLFKNISYVDLSGSTTPLDAIPKVGSSIEVGVLNKMTKLPRMNMSFAKYGNWKVYHTRKLRYFVQFLDCAPIIYNEDGSVRETSELKEIPFNNEIERNSALAIYLSTLFFWFFITFSDCRNLNKREVDAFPCSFGEIASPDLADLGVGIVKNLQSNSYYLTAEYAKYGVLRMQAFKPRLSKEEADKIDELLAKHYGFTEEELDFIINYDIKYRMGDELNAE